MEELGRNLIEVEYHQIEMPYSRLKDTRALMRLAVSISEVGQQEPVLVADMGERLVLLDGYQRVAAMQQCGRDTIWAECIKCNPADGLLLALRRSHGRQWEPLEEADLIHRLVIEHGKSLREVAHALGRKVAWVQGRLRMLEELPEPILNAVRGGVLGAWVANRVMRPLARANPEHATRLLDSLRREPISSRDLEAFMKQYTNSSRKSRARMIENPSLAVKALRFRKEEQKAAKLRGGPEEVWLDELDNLKRAVVRLQEKTDFLHMLEGFRNRDDLRDAFDKVDIQWRHLEEKMNRSRCNEKRDESGSAELEENTGGFDNGPVKGSATEGGDHRGKQTGHSIDDKPGVLQTKNESDPKPFTENHRPCDSKRNLESEETHAKAGDFDDDSVGVSITEESHDQTGRSNDHSGNDGSRDLDPPNQQGLEDVTQNDTACPEKSGHRSRPRRCFGSGHGSGLGNHPNPVQGLQGQRNPGPGNDGPTTQAINSLFDLDQSYSRDGPEKTQNQGRQL